jgi:hypothetical protein
MTANLDALPERVEAIEHKLDALSLSVDNRFAEIDKRFDEVSERFVEQRQYTEFAFGQLERRMNEGFTRLEKSLAAGSDLERLERKLDQFIDSQSRRDPRLKARRRKR